MPVGPALVPIGAAVIGLLGCGPKKPRSDPPQIDQRAPQTYPGDPPQAQQVLDAQPEPPQAPPPQAPQIPNPPPQAKPPQVPTPPQVDPGFSQSTEPAHVSPFDRGR